MKKVHCKLKRNWKLLLNSTQTHNALSRKEHRYIFWSKLESGCSDLNYLRAECVMYYKRPYVRANKGFYFTCSLFFCLPDSLHTCCSRPAASRRPSLLPMLIYASTTQFQPLSYFMDRCYSGISRPSTFLCTTPHP